MLITLRGQRVQEHPHYLQMASSCCEMSSRLSGDEYTETVMGLLHSSTKFK